MSKVHKGLLEIYEKELLELNQELPKIESGAVLSAVYMRISFLEEQIKHLKAGQ